MRVQQLRHVAANYPHLQGLRIVPVGILFLVMAAGEVGALSWKPPMEHASKTLFLGGLVLAISASYGIERGYHRRYGHAGHIYGAGIPALLIVAGLWAVAVWLQQLFRVPVALGTLVVAAALLWLGSQAGAIRWHYLPIGLIWAAAGCGLLSMADLNRDALFYGLIGLSMLLGGLGDHRLLTRTMQQYERDPA